jgi:uncharacterized protein (TIGR03435 family)
MPIFVSEEWVERLGRTLLHFLWQGLLVAAVYAPVRRALSYRSPQARYLLACAALTLMAAAPVATWVWMRPPAAVADAAWRIVAAPPNAVATRADSPRILIGAVSAAESPRFLFAVVALWLAGTLAFWARLAGGWVLTVRMRSKPARPAPVEWQQVLARFAARLGISRTVRLLVSARVEVPVVVGWLRPVVLVPVEALAGVPARHLEAILLHELAHILRRDYLVNLLQAAVEALLFYHPAVWWISGHIRTERELCCDDLAVAATGDVLTYATALAQLESWRPAHACAAVAASGPKLADRIRRLLGDAQPAPGAGFAPGVLAAAILLAAAGWGLFGQAADHPTFQTVSIRRNPAGMNERVQRGVGVGYQPGGRLVATGTSVKLLIQFAYGPHDSPHSLPLPASQVVGGPDWIDSFGYDIEARAATAATPDEVWLMLQTLLADRFHLALHRETRQMPLYVLSAAASGPKLPAAKPAECVSFPPGTRPRPVPGKVDCGYVPVLSESGALRMTGSRLRMADLIRELTAVLGRPGLDRTGFTREFDLDLRFAASEALAGLPADFRARIPSDLGAASLFAAMEAQLGLKLAAASGPVDVLVIDPRGTAGGELRSDLPYSRDEVLGFAEAGPRHAFVLLKGEGDAPARGSLDLPRRGIVADAEMEHLRRCARDRRHGQLALPRLTHPAPL